MCVDNRSALTLTLLQMHTSLCTESANYNLYEQTRDGRRRTSMEQSEAKIGQLRLSEEEMMDIVVDDIDRYEQLSNREELLALASALAGNEAVLEVVPTLDRIDPIDVTGIPVAQTQNYVDPDNVDTSNDEGVRQDRHVIKDNRNKNTCTKTKSDLKMFYEWALSNGEMRMTEDIPFPELDGLLAKIILGMFEQNFI